MVLLEPAAEAAAVLQRCAEETAAAPPESNERTPTNLRMTGEEIDDWNKYLERSELKCRAKERSAPHFKMLEDEVIAPRYQHNTVVDMSKTIRDKRQFIACPTTRRIAKREESNNINAKQTKMRKLERMAESLSNT